MRRSESGEWVYDSFDGKVKGFQTHRIYAAKLVENCVQGIAAALAMPSSPYLRPGHYAVGVQAATYGGEQGFGARATFQMSNHWSANAGVAGGTGIYGQVGGTVGVQYEG